MAPAASSQRATEAQAAETVDGGELFRSLIDKPRAEPPPPKMAASPELARLLEMPLAPAAPPPSRTYDPFSVPDDFGEFMQMTRRQMEEMQYLKMRRREEEMYRRKYRLDPPSFGAVSECPICAGRDPRCGYRDRR